MVQLADQQTTAVLMATVTAAHRGRVTKKSKCSCSMLNEMECCALCFKQAFSLLFCNTFQAFSILQPKFYFLCILL